MDNRTRIRNTITGAAVDRAPFFFLLGAWGETVERWHAEGLAVADPWDAEFGFDPGIRSLCEYGDSRSVNLGFSPWFPGEVVEDRGETLVIRDRFGVLQETRRDGGSLPRHLANPVQADEDWDRIKAERLDPADPARFPADWKRIAAEAGAGDRFLQIGDYPFGLFGTCRELLGPEELLVSFHTRPALVHDMMETLADLWIALFERIVADVRVDGVHLWEDMSGKNGSLISPAMVREFMLPAYRRIDAFRRDAGIPVFSVDTDGDVRELAPLFHGAGVNFLWPFEVAAGCDIREYRTRYPGLAVMGGLDKRAIAVGPAAIDRELERAREALALGRYIPGPDHAVHPEVSLENFRYFVEGLRRVCAGAARRG